MISSKLYDPFEISSPANDVTSSNENFKTSSSSQSKKFQSSTNFEEKKAEGNKATNIQQSSISMIMGKLPSFLDYGENMVTSSDGVNQYHQAKPSNSGTAKVDVVAQKPPSYPTPTLNDTLESPYSPNDGYDHDDLFDMPPGKKSPKTKAKKIVKGSTKVFDALFGSTSPVALPKSKDKKRRGKASEAGDNKVMFHYFSLFLSFVN